jgi:ppGpp synthetase/RelA/SpoT-type nucleotidyltranferase
MPKKMVKDNAWLKKHVAAFKRVRPHYKRYAELLDGILHDAAHKYAHMAIVQVRPKAISSFAEKIQRKIELYNDPLRDMTDLCGARVITQTSDQVAAISRFIEQSFIIDWENTVDNTMRLKPTEFGYRSIHYIVQFKSRKFTTPFKTYDIPGPLVNPKHRLKAEIQVRTLCEHAWADFSHDVFYKGQFNAPDDLKRAFNSTAASLERIDSTFIQLKNQLKIYASNFKSYMSDKKIAEEIDKLEFALQYAPDDYEMVNRIGLLCIAAGLWDKAVKILDKYAKTGYQPILRDLGIALCKKYKGTPRHPEFSRGQRLLAVASRAEYGDVDALCSYAGTFKDIDEAKVCELYRKAYETDPCNPYALGNYLECEIGRRKDALAITMAAPTIRAAIAVCRQQAQANVNIPWAYYDMGKFHLLLNEPYASLISYAKAATVSSAPFMIESSIGSLRRFEAIQGQIAGFEWVKGMLLLALAARFPEHAPASSLGLRRLATPKAVAISTPVVLLAGGCDASVETTMRGYHGLLIEAFRHFRGTVVSGGTTAGICALAGDLGQQYAGSVKTIGYVPARIPADTTVDRNRKRYAEIRVVGKAGDFSPLGFLQCWTDIFASGIKPGQVKLLGINGGSIAASEYRVALALGAEVCVIGSSGREADILAADGDWQIRGKLSVIPADPATIDAFINPPTTMLTPKEREALAVAIHESYRQERMASLTKVDDALLPWQHLPETLRQSNLEQADHMFLKLERIGCQAKRGAHTAVPLFSFSKDQIETMAVLEHGRWNLERCRDGWRHGEVKNLANKINPSIVPWKDLSDEVREYDRRTVRKIPEFLAAAGFEVCGKK